MVRGDFEISDNIADFYKAVHDNAATFAVFDSRGGSVLKAIELGRAIRALNLSTMQVRGIECASACSLAFMGGAQRYAEPGSIGVHKSSFADTSGLSVEDAVSVVQQLTANVIAYMTEMGVDPGILQLALQYDSSDIRYLSGSEMERYRVAQSFTATQAPASVSAFVPPSSTDQPSSPPPALPQADPSVASLDSAPPTFDQSLLSIPVAHTGRVQHPKGSVQMKAGPNSGTRTVAVIANGMAVTVLGDTEKWFEVRAGGKVGFMHHSWVWVEQYEAAPFGRKFVQVKSFDNLTETQKYIQGSPLPLVAYLATNGWFAITLDHTFDSEEVAASLVKSLKNRGSIPNDSVMTFGNAFVRKVCCSR
ncbi:hypothetical protein HJB56_26235 [Rhizobium lentis]|uniref:SH3 domain-containing protein n=1 Tax=Rhizobium lentis TaxID=1138194 RepID=UPI001C82E9BA|nr:SH3 domain-containing protein [Rhizobium lentis]MBX5086229.1 hypothetical protein [Rhizobium lentis]MBX5096341.1 hypothetical protein [Rhizobium lentis]MBX5123509.1 hypothetical protein [Rhizobium lentis]